MRLIVENRFALLGLVMVALLALFGVASLTDALAGRTRTLPPEEAAVRSAVRLCPPPQGDDRSSEIAAFTPRPQHLTGTGGNGEQGADGRMAVAENAADASPLGESTDVGAPWTEDVSDTDRHTVVRANGTMATGLEVTQTTLGEDDPYATETRCAEPTMSTWFAAPGGDQLDGLRLLMANADDDQATVNVDLYATDGPVLSRELRGIPVDAHGQAELSLGRLIEATGAVGVHVRTNTGRVAASLYADRSGEGQDWVPPTRAPAKRQVVPGIPGGNGTRQLVVAAPGDEPVTATVGVYTSEGRIDHDSLHEVTVPPAASTTLSLAGPLDKKAGGVVVTADRPVVAGVASHREAGGRDDTAYAASAEPLTSTAVLPANPKGTSTDLVLSALDDAASAVATPISADGTAGKEQRVEVKADHTRSVELKGAKDAHAVVLRVDGNPAGLYAGRVLTQGSGDDYATATHPVAPAPARVTLPPADDSLTSVVPGG